MQISIRNICAVKNKTDKIRVNIQKEIVCKCGKIVLTSGNCGAILLFVAEVNKPIPTSFNKKVEKTTKVVDKAQCT